jgi:hypothetical protein
MKFTKEQLLSANTDALKQLLFKVEGRDTLPEAEGPVRERPTVYRVYLFEKTNRVPVCSVCKKAPSVVRPNLTVRDTCNSKACVDRSNVSKAQATLKGRYGVTNASKLAWVKQKKIETCKANFGVAFPQQSAEAKTTLKQNNLKKYGKENVSQVESVKAKRNETFQERFGGNPFANDKIKAKIVATNRKRYGVDYPVATEEVRDKAKATLKRNYGVTVPAQSEAVRQKMRTTCLERFGTEHASSNAEVKAKMKAAWTAELKIQANQKRVLTFEERYGTRSAIMTPGAKEKMKDTLRTRYGVDHPSRSADILAKTKATNLARYGGHPMQDPEFFARHSSKGYHIRYAQCDPQKLLPLRGVEPLVVDRFKEYYGDTIRIGPGKLSPRIEYLHPIKKDCRVYHPDFCVQHTKTRRVTVVEVKSSYTAGATSLELFQINRAKYRAATKLLNKHGMKFVLCLDAGQGRVLVLQHPEELKTLGQLRALLDKHNITW